MKGFIVHSCGNLLFIPESSVCSIKGSGNNFTIYYGSGGYIARDVADRSELIVKDYSEYLYMINNRKEMK